MKTIYIGAGCFWGAQEYYNKIKGVISTTVGYANGPSQEVTYEEVCNSEGHAEVVKVSFDKKILSPEALFFSYIRIIDPFSLNRQGNDVGIQYRVGLYFDDEQFLRQMREILNKWEEENKKTVIETGMVKNYVEAEPYHQNYLRKNSHGYCHINLSNIPDNLRK